MGTIVILLILRLGQVMSVGFEKIILMYNPGTYSVADVISTYTYRRGYWKRTTALGGSWLVQRRDRPDSIADGQQDQQATRDISLW